MMVVVELKPVVNKALNSVLLRVVVVVVGGELKAAERARAAGREPRQNAVGMVHVAASQLLSLRILRKLLLTDSAHGGRRRRRHLDGGDDVNVGLGSRQ